MTKAKYSLFDSDLQENAAIFKALSHPARLAIIKFLAETKTCMTGDISDELPLSRTTVNQHLSELKNASLIVGQTEGVRVNYCLNSKKLESVKKEIARLFDYIDNCC
jgi:DNA-binding transcriptional ArsR family regulator